MGEFMSISHISSMCSLTLPTFRRSIHYPTRSEMTLYLANNACDMLHKASLEHYITNGSRQAVQFNMFNPGRYDMVDITEIIKLDQYSDIRAQWFDHDPYETYLMCAIVVLGSGVVRTVVVPITGTPQPRPTADQYIC